MSRICSRLHEYTPCRSIHSAPFAVARPKLSGLWSSSTILSQVYLGLPVLCRQSLGGPLMQAWRARDWCWHDRGDHGKTGAVDGWYLPEAVVTYETEPHHWRQNTVPKHPYLYCIRPASLVRFPQTVTMRRSRKSPRRSEALTDDIMTSGRASTAWCSPAAE